MRNSNSLPILVFVVLLGAGLAFAYSKFALAEPEKAR